MKFDRQTLRLPLESIPLGVIITFILFTIFFAFLFFQRNRIYRVGHSLFLRRYKQQQEKENIHFDEPAVICVIYDPNHNPHLRLLNVIAIPIETSTQHTERVMTT